MKKVLVAAAATVISGLVKAQNSKFVGEWVLVSIENTNADSSKSFPYGDNPAGLLVFEASGDYAIQILKAERPKVASNNKNTATPQENEALVKGANAHFGKYVIDETKHTITYKVEKAFFPNWEGRDLTAAYILEGDVLKSLSAFTTNGGASAVVTWKRKK